MNSEGTQGKKVAGGRGQSLVAPQSPSVKRSSSFRRNGSLGKGPHKTTTPQRPMLATEARSLVRPCGCGKDGVFKAHGHSHDSHHRVPVTPERTLREPKTPRSPQVVRKSWVTSPPQEQQQQQQQPERNLPLKLPEPPMEPVPQAKAPSPPSPPPQEEPQSPIPSVDPPRMTSTPPSPKPKEEEKKPKRTVAPPAPLFKTPKPLPKPTLTLDTKPSQKDKGFNRFVSTVVWYPEQKPEFNSTTLTLLPGEDSARYVDEILLKEYDTYFRKNFPDLAGTQGKLQNETYFSKQVVSESSPLREGSLVPPKMSFNPVSVS